jgi:hypothetical protein
MRKLLNKLKDFRQWMMRYPLVYMPIKGARRIWMYDRASVYFIGAMLAVLILPPLLLPHIAAIAFYTVFEAVLGLVTWVSYRRYHTLSKIHIGRVEIEGAVIATLLIIGLISWEMLVFGIPEHDFDPMIW